VPNDEITDALVAPFGSSSTGPLHNGSSYGATRSYPQFCSQADPDDDTWYRFTATATAHTVRAVQRNTLFTEPNIFGTPYVEVYDTLSINADTLQAHLVSCGAAPRSLTGLQIGRDYWYRVYTAGSAPAELCLFSTWVQDQSNDEADGAVELSYADRSARTTSAPLAPRKACPAPIAAWTTRRTTTSGSSSPPPTSPRA
jgi:hypothetical protein